MKLHSLSVHVLAGAAVAFLTFGIGIGHAASATPGENAGGNFVQSPEFQPVKWEETRIEKLRHAYSLLEHADTDYGGHRVEAMRSIKKAAEVLGVELNGRGHAEENQWESDRRIREAKHLLQDLADESQGKEQPHVHRAIKELDKALAIK